MLLATATGFSSILYAVSKYTHGSPDRPTWGSLGLVVGALCLLYVPREVPGCADTAIEDHIEVSFLIVMSELGRVAYGVGFDTLAPGITAAHVASYLSTRLWCVCNVLQVVWSVLLVVGCVVVHCRRRVRSDERLVGEDLPQALGVGVVEAGAAALGAQEAPLGAPFLRF